MTFTIAPTDQSSGPAAFNAPSRLLRSTRFALLIGFGGLLAVITLAGIDTLRVMGRIRTTDDQIRSQFLFRNHVLNDIRSNVYLSGTYVRDYLLDPDVQRAESYRTSLENTRKEMDASLETYGSQLKPEEGHDYAALTVELSHYWEILGPVLKLKPEQRSRQGYVFLRDEVFPRRAAMLEIAGRIAALNEQQLAAGNSQVVALLSRFQNRLAVSLLITIALGFGMAAFSTLKILRLEKRANDQYKEMSGARHQLENLSARLVQVQETERRSVARELHDEVGQSLSAVLIELRHLSTWLPMKSEEQARSHIENIKGLVESTIRVVRNMSLLLRPSMLDDLGLVPALQWQAREVSKRTAMNVNLTTELVSDDLPDEHKTCIYRIVQEALNNCSRHSNATTVRVRVEEQPGQLRLSVQDNGQGFDVRQAKGLGLLGIEERVARLGGWCKVQSEPGSGTTLSVELPFNNSLGSEKHETHSHPIGG